MKPVIGVPMGDAAGVGPEIAAAAAADPETRARARVVVVGHEACLRRGAEAMKIVLPVRRVTEDCRDLDEHAIQVLHMDNLDADAVVMGAVSGACGAAAYDYIKRSVELCVKGVFHATATTPINKESFQAGGVPFIGHTEAFGALTRTENPLTMFQVRGLRVFFLTRHLSLVDACKAVTRRRVLDCTVRCVDALRRLGLVSPRLAVAGLNPHCGERGLFGHEEDREISPAVEDARRLGYDVEGPYPADSVFHQALEGRWDAVLSLYHDQGHIAAKTLDFHKTVSLTLGMPILRASVDHGTAFDIAGKGLVNPTNMLEAIRLAALYAPAFAKKTPPLS